MPTNPPDIEAEIRFLTTEEGGRTTPARSGYRPQFYYDGHDWDAHQVYPDAEWVKPGDSVRTLLWFLSPDVHAGRVHVGMDFEIREGARVVGRGHITKILNLEESAAKARRAR